MNIVSQIQEFLKKTGNVSISGFGTFYLKSSNAVLDKEGKSILPPGKEIAFRNDVENTSDDFVKFVAAQNNLPLIDAQIEIKKHVNFWNAALYKEKTLTIENLGRFSLDESKIHFTGIRTENLSADFYGLEEITFSEIKTNRRGKSGSYKTSNSLWWLVPLLVGIAGITYFGITQPEKLFGKRTFGKIPSPKVAEKVPVKDSVQTIISPEDSIKTDTIQHVIITAESPSTTN